VIRDIIFLQQGSTVVNTAVNITGLKKKARTARHGIWLGLVETALFELLVAE
jgi:hypothetical protein